MRQSDRCNSFLANHGDGARHCFAAPLSRPRHEAGGCAAADVCREAMREVFKQYSLWYLIQGVLLIIAGFLAIMGSGLIGILLSLILWASLPVTAAWLI